MWQAAEEMQKTKQETMQQDVANLEIRLDGTLLAHCLPDLLHGHYLPDLLPPLAVHFCMGG